MLDNRVAVITGGANGIGKASGEMFLRHGATVVIIDVDNKGQKISEEWVSQGHRASFYKTDITDYENTLTVFNKIKDEYGRIDILINNAGITRDASLKKMSTEQWKQVIDVNLTGVFNCTKAVVQHMIEQGFGRIINTSSVVGLYGNYGQTNYAATKAGVIGMTMTWAKELGRHNITVNAVAPGFINTDMVKTVPETVLTNMKQKSPLNRLGEVEDIANAYLYLASEMGAFVTGTTLSVDGGLVI